MNNKLIAVTWLLLPVILFVLSASGYLAITPLGMIEETSVYNTEILDSAMMAGSWLLLGWGLPLLIGVLFCRLSRENKRGS